MGRLVLTSEDIEELFSTEPWQGPAMLEVRGERTFDLMSKLISPSGLVSTTNCVREDRVLNIEGFDSHNMSYIRLISTRKNNSVEVAGTLYDTNGNVVGNVNSVLVSKFTQNQPVWVNRNDLADRGSAEWNGEALLDYLKERPETEVQSLFVSQKNTAFTANALAHNMLKLFKDTSFEGASSHSQRRGFATACIRAGVDIVSLKTLMNHARIGQTS